MKKLDVSAEFENIRQIQITREATVELLDKQLKCFEDIMEHMRHIAESSLAYNHCSNLIHQLRLYSRGTFLGLECSALPLKDGYEVEPMQECLK